MELHREHKMVMLVYFDLEAVGRVVCVGPFPSHEAAEREAGGDPDARTYWTVEVAPPMVLVH